MSNAVDNRVVQLEMDNGSFERNANQSIRTLDKLDNALNFKNGGRSFDEVEAAAAKCNFKPLLSAADTVVHKFSAMEIAGITAIQNITNRVVNMGIQMGKSLSIDQVSTGFSKYEQKTSNMQTLINSTGKSIDEINKHLDRLMWFSDETSYGFTDMTQALATMVNAGGDIDKVTPMIEGIANSVAFAGRGAVEFNRVMYNLNQSYSAGFLQYRDWRSVMDASANSKQLVETLIRAGEEAGTIKKGEVTIENFNETLSKKWANREVMESAFGYFDEMTQKAYEMIGTMDEEGNVIETATQAYDILSKKYDTVSLKAAKAGQQAKSFSEAIGSVKDAVSSGWMRTFEIIFGDYEQAKELWTDVSEGLWNIFAGGFGDRNNLLEEVFQTSPVKKYAQSLEDAGVKFDEFKSKLKQTYRENGKGMSDQEFETLTAGATTFEELLGQTWVKAGLLEKTIAKLPKDLTQTVTTAKKASGNVADLLKDVNAGKYGYGIEEQQKRLAEAGIDGSDALGGNWLQTLYNKVYEGNEETIDGLNKTLFSTEEVTDAVEEQTTVWDDLAKQAKEFDNDGYYAQNTGRTIMLDGLKNVLGAVSDRLDVVKKSWEKAFPALTAERLRNMIITFHSFTKSLKMGSDEGERIAAVADRVFSVLAKVRDALGAIGKVGISAFNLAVRFGQWFVKLEPVAKAITNVKQFLDSLHGGALSGLDSFIGKLSKFAETLDGLNSEDFDKLLKKMDPLIKKWEKLKAAAEPVISTISSFFGEVGTWISTNLLTPFGEFISAVIESEDPIGTLMAGLETFCERVKAKFRQLWATIKSGNLGTIKEWVKTTFPSLANAVDKVSEAFKKLTTNADGTKKSLDFSKVISLLTFAVLVAVIAKIGSALTSIQKAADTIKTTFSSLNKFLTPKFGNTFAGNVRTIALACVALAGSLWLVASIPGDKLKAAAIALGVLMVILGALAGVMTFVSTKLSKKDLKTVNGLVKPMLGLSASILILSFALKNAAAALDGVTGVEATFTRVGAILALIGGLGLEVVGLAALMSLLPGKVKLMSVVMFIVAAALLKMASALDIIKDIEFSDEAWQLIVWIGIISVILALIDRTASKMPDVKGFSKMTNILVGLAALIAGTYFAILALEKLKTIKFEELAAKWKEAVTVLGVVTVVGVAVGLIGKFIKPASESAKNIGIGILAITASLYLITLLVQRLAAIGDAGMVDSAATALTWIIGVMAGMVVALGYASKLSEGGNGVLKIAASLLVVTASIALMVGLLKIIDGLFGQMTLAEFAPIGGILLGLVVLMSLLAVAVGKAGQLGDGKGTSVLIAAVVGVIALAAVLVVLTSFTADQLAPGVLAMAVIMVGLAVLMCAIGKAVEAATSNSGSGGAVGLIAAVGTLIAIAGAILVLSKFSFGEMIGSVIAMGALAAVVAACMVALSKFEIKPSVLTKILASVAVLYAIVGAIALIVPSLQALATIPFDDLLANMIVLVAAIVILAGAMTLLGGIAGASMVGVLGMLAIAGVLVAIGLLCVAFAASMAVLANVDYSVIASGLLLCAEPMMKIGDAGLSLIIGAVGVALMAGAIALFGLAAQSAAGGIAQFSVSIEYLLGILSAIGRAFQKNNGNILGALADLDSELQKSANSVETNATKLQKSLAKVTGSKVVDMSGVQADIGNGFGQAAGAIEAQTGPITDAMVGAVQDAGAKAETEAATQGAKAGRSFWQKLKDFATGNGPITVNPETNPTANLTGNAKPNSTAPYAEQQPTFDPSLMSPNARRDYGEIGAEDAQAYLRGRETAMAQAVEENASMDPQEYARSMGIDPATLNEAATTVGEQAGESTQNGLLSLFSNGNFDVSKCTAAIQSMFNQAGANVDFTQLTNILGGNLGQKLQELIGSIGSGEGSFDLTSIIEQFTNTSLENADFSEGGSAAAKATVEAYVTELGSSASNSEAKSAATGISNSANDGLRSADTAASGSYFSQGFINGILSKLGDVVSAAVSLANAANEAFNGTLQINSPSRLTTQSGKYFTEGFIIGIDMRAMYAAAAAYKMGSDSIDALNAGIRNGEITRVMPVLDTSDLYNQMDEFDGIYRPIIKPTLDMSDVDPAYRNMTAVATARYSGYDGESGPQGASVSGGSVVNYTQNNYSPKALSSVEIYRQTKNQLNSLEKRFAKK